jgi:monoamine oxidase
MFNGKCVKVVAIYRDIFWEINRMGADGSTTMGDLSEGFVRNLFPARVGSFPALVGLVTADKATELGRMSPENVQSAVISQFKQFFGSEEAETLLNDFYFMNWSQEEYSGGCFEALAPPGDGVIFAKHGSTCEGKLHFTCSEFGREWPGYLEGAVESADRVAEEVHRALGIRDQW